MDVGSKLLISCLSHYLKSCVSKEKLFLEGTFKDFGVPRIPIFDGVAQKVILASNHSKIFTSLNKKQ